MHCPGSPQIACTLVLLVATHALAQAPELHPELQKIPGDQAAAVLGRRVLDRGGDQIGTMVNVLIDGSGRPVAAVVEFGGYLGVGTRRIAVDWTRLRFAIAGDDTHVTVELDGNTIAAAPEYKGGSDGASVLTGPAPKQ